MEVVYKEVGKSAKKITIEGKLKEFQDLVGGYIQTYNLSDDLILILNEEGKLLNLPFNFAISSHRGYVEEIVGNVVVCSVKPMDGEMHGLNEKHIEFLKQMGFMDLK